MRGTPWFTLLPAALLIPLIGCFGASEDTSGPEDTDPLVCAELSLEDCATEGVAQCSLLSGRALQDDGAGGQCVDFSVDSEPMGCIDDDQGCGDAETVAAPADDPENCTHWFPSTCLPDGYVYCGSSIDECAP
ncbi:MAG: hypothetical protein VX899_23550 [Myxococcota bacterium]|nr:hypothetical protein [Myxococcota bacterium]